jgi:hypothetical protein
LTDVVLSEVEGYAGKMLNGYAYLTVSPDHSVFTVVSVGKVKDERITNLSLLVRIVGEQVVIEQDDSNKPLVDALVQAGIPLNQIILDYAGEPVPETAA